MSVVDQEDLQLTFKLVYCGAVGVGKTSNLHALERLIEADHRGPTMPLGGADQRIPIFDLLPLFFRIGGVLVRIKVFAVPGKASARMTRRAVLRGADGVVFVADSRPSQASANQQAYAELEEELQALEGIESAPFVTQFNKRDLADALPLDPFANEPCYEASAGKGHGVAETFLAVAEKIWEADQNHSDLLQERVSAQAFRAALAAHIAEA